MESSSAGTSLDIFHEYKFDQTELYTWLKSNNFNLIAVQLPEGLRLQGIHLIKNIETELGITVILMADPCFGACDVNTTRLESLGVDAIVHFGHAEIPITPQPQIPIKFIELQARVDPCEFIQREKNLEVLKSEFLPSSAIGLVANIQFIIYLDDIKTMLEKENFQVHIGSGAPRIKYRGQVIGCNFSAAQAIGDRVDGFLFIGDGMFHPLGVSLATNKKVLAFNPYNNTIHDMSSLRDEILRQRSAAISAALDCQNFGILLSTKPGQKRLGYALQIKEKLKQNNRSGTLLGLGTITPNQIDYLPYNAYINTACPRLAIDDYQQYKKVIITPVELEIILGERRWENYKFDEIM